MDTVNKGENIGRELDRAIAELDAALLEARRAMNFKPLAPKRVWMTKTGTALVCIRGDSR